MKGFHGFYGQEQVVAFLNKQLQGAKALGKPMPHLLIGGSSGMGKTKLASSLAKEYGSTYHRVLGKPSPRQICDYIVHLEAGDFLFLDESHALKRDAQELLFELIDAGKVKDLFQGQDPQDINVKRDKQGKLLAQPCTVILATDQPGKLLEALLRRVKHRVVLSMYAEDELEEIGRATASKIGIVVSDLAMKRIALAGQGQPRRMEQILEGIQLCFYKNPKRQIKTEHVKEYLDSAGIDSEGIDHIQQLYLRCLGRLGQTGLETIGHQLDSDIDYVKSQVEPGLKRKGFVVITKAGRELTPDGRQWYKDWKAKQLAKKGDKK